MFRPVTRAIARPSAARALPRPAISAAPKRYVSTAPPTQKKRSWKSMAVRLGLAGGIIYYYNTTDVFAEEPRRLVHSLPSTGPEATAEELQTLEAVAEQRRKRKAEAEAKAAALAKKTEAEAKARAEAAAVAGEGAMVENQGTQSVEDLEAEAGQQGAFNPETGEINWDCPCLGGMAHGPCGEEFKAAFSCFVYSTEEPKGMDCIEKFKDMQNCFRQYPEIYGSEIDNDDDEDNVPADGAPLPASTEVSGDSTPTSSRAPSPQASSESTDGKVKAERTTGAADQAKHNGDAEKQSTSSPADVNKLVSAEAGAEPKKSVKEAKMHVSEVIPKGAYDQTAVNEKVQEKEQERE